MPNIALVLKGEIRRIARREVRLECDPLKSQVNELKKTVKEQKQTIKQLEKALAKLPDQSAPAVLDSAAGKQSTARITASFIKRQRTRLKLSQRELGQLLRVSTNTIVRWEAGTSKPRATHQIHLADLPGLGIKTIRKILET